MNDVERVEKPWGYELRWAKTDRYVGKIIHVNKGHALSLQYHNQKDETIYLWSGKLLFEIDVNGTLTKREMSPGECVHVTPNDSRMTAIETATSSKWPPGAARRGAARIIRQEDKIARRTSVPSS